MKRLISCLLLAVLIVSFFPIAGRAEGTAQGTIYYDDGSYMTVKTTVIHTRAAGSVTGNKTYTYYDSEGTTRWMAVLTGSFSYTGTTATCTASNVNVSIYGAGWYVSSKSATKSGNTASASVTMGRRVAGVTIMTVPVSLSLSCDANGNLS